jgi:hypothetical protein
MGLRAAVLVRAGPPACTPMKAAGAKSNGAIAANAAGSDDRG